MDNLNRRQFVKSSIVTLVGTSAVVASPAKPTPDSYIKFDLDEIDRIGKLIKEKVSPATECWNYGDESVREIYHKMIDLVGYSYQDQCVNLGNILVGLNKELSLYGVAFLWFHRGKWDNINEFHVLNTPNVIPQPSNEMFPDGYYRIPTPEGPIKCTRFYAIPATEVIKLESPYFYKKAGPNGESYKLFDSRRSSLPLADDYFTVYYRLEFFEKELNKKLVHPYFHKNISLHLRHRDDQRWGDFT